MNANTLHKRRSIGIVAATALLGVAVLAGTSAAADPFQAGQTSTRTLTLPDQAWAVLPDRADAHLRQLGLQRGVRRSIERLEDRFENTTYDEVTEIGDGDQPTALLRYGTDGVLRSAIALGWHEGRGPRLPNAESARARARTFARASGVPDGEPTAELLADETGWRVSWPRIVDGVPVVGDGLRIDLWTDGSLHSLVRSERELATRPDTLIGEDQARALAEDFLRTTFKDRQSDLTIDAIDLEWIAPNDAFDPTAPDAPDSTLRLARVVRVSATGSVGDQHLEGLEIYLDAGDGRILGGDVQE